MLRCAAAILDIGFLVWYTAGVPRGAFTSTTDHMNVTERSAKADIIDAAVELTDTQAERIADLEQDRRALWFLTAALLAFNVLSDPLGPARALSCYPWLISTHRSPGLSWP